MTPTRTNKPASAGMTMRHGFDFGGGGVGGSGSEARVRGTLSSYAKAAGRALITVSSSRSSCIVLRGASLESVGTTMRFVSLDKDAGFVAAAETARSGIFPAAGGERASDNSPAV